jgi:hypothetical protein
MIFIQRSEELSNANAVDKEVRALLARQATTHIQFAN